MQKSSFNSLLYSFFNNFIGFLIFKDIYLIKTNKDELKKPFIKLFLLFFLEILNISTTKYIKANLQYILKLVLDIPLIILTLVLIEIFWK